MKPKSALAVTSDYKKIAEIIDGGAHKKKAKMPEDVKPMLATLVDSPVEAAGWIYEIKWDGFRSIAYVNEGKVDIRSRNNKDFNDKFYPIFKALQDWKINAVFDGEIVVLNDQGLPDFAALQTWRSEADGELVYYIFDVIWIEGLDLMMTPLSLRRKVLEQIKPESNAIRLSMSTETSAKDFFAVAEKMGLEGIIAKKLDSLYLPDIRSKDWLKIKSQKFQEVVIGGYTKNENTSKKFSALLLGIYENNELVPITPVGTGFTVKMQNEILEKLKPFETKTCPFREVPEFNKPSRFRPNPPKAEVTWVKPKVVAEISYRTVGSDGAFRHPSFKGLREDKNPQEVVFETAVPAADIMEEESSLVKDKVISTPGKKERKTLLNPKDETQVRSIGGHDMKFGNLSKIFWPNDNVSKRDMLNYYYQVVPYMLPYLKDRPQTLNRFPNGIEGISFYQKDVKGKAPDWIETYKYYSDADEREKEFLVCTNEASLLYIASLGCIEMNPWNSRTQHPDNPDWCIIDLDPDKNTFEQVIKTAQVTKEVLDEIGVPSFPKTSGSTGIHIYIPLGAKYTYEDSKEFGRAIATIIQSRLPEFTSIERLTANRKGKIYIDFLQNRPQATVAGPYSLRPKPGATVSMPLHWDEVKIGLQMKDFTIKNSLSRIKEQGDLFKGVLGKGIDMKKALVKIEGLKKKHG
ncbi:MAG TPA: DNA ligase D [Cytophagaceae bacterium]